MLPSCHHSLRVERLNGIVSQLFLFKPRKRDVDGFLRVRDLVPPLFDDLTSLFVAHEGKLIFDRGCCLALVNAVGAHTLDSNPSCHVTKRLDLLFFSPQRIQLSLDLVKLLLVLLEHQTGLRLELLSSACRFLCPLLLQITTALLHL